jgi:general secretion pathway protein C
LNYFLHSLILRKDKVAVVVVGSKILFLSARFFLLALLSYFSALAVNNVVAAWLTLPPSVQQLEESLPPPTTRFTPPLSSYTIVYTRDIFNSIKAPVQTEALVVATNNSAFKLWGTAVRERERAFAIIEDQSTHVQGLYREGEMVAAGVTLVQVGWDQVILDRNGRRETLTLPTDAPGVPTQPMVTAATPALRQDQDGIRQVAQDTFQLDRREMDHAMENLNDLFTQVRAVPYADGNGATQGFRLFSIKPQSLIERLGLKNGDIVQRVNGVEISDPSTAFSLLQDLQGRSQVRVDVLRNRQPVTLSYEIRQ